MLKKEFTYTDFFGTERTDTCYFNLSKTEVVEYNYSRKGGLEKVLENIVEAKDEVRLMKEFKSIVLLAYGEKSEDGRRFMKSEEISHAFTETPMYDMLMQELITDEATAIAFINGIMPKVEDTEKSGTAPVALPGA